MSFRPAKSTKLAILKKMCYFCLLKICTTNTSIVSLLQLLHSQPGFHPVSNQLGSSSVLAHMPAGSWRELGSWCSPSFCWLRGVWLLGSPVVSTTSAGSWESLGLLFSLSWYNFCWLTGWEWGWVLGVPPAGVTYANSWEALGLWPLFCFKWYCFQNLIFYVQIY